MSEQEVGEMMAAAEGQNDNVTTPAEETPESAPAQEAETPVTVVLVANTTPIYDVVNNNLSLVSGWSKVNLALENGTAVTDTHQVLVGIDTTGIPVMFNCHNLAVPTELIASGITQIKVMVSGVIIKKADCNIYVTKNNIFVYDRDAAGNHIRSTMYYKVKGGNVEYKIQNSEATTAADAELVKFTIKTQGGRLYSCVADLNDTAAQKEAILNFLEEKVNDINYCIKIEKILMQIGF